MTTHEEGKVVVIWQDNGDGRELFRHVLFSDDDSFTLNKSGEVVIALAGCGTVIGSPGADVIVGRDTHDNMRGGGGSDMLEYSAGNAAVR